MNKRILSIIVAAIYMCFAACQACFASGDVTHITDGKADPHAIPGVSVSQSQSIINLKENAISVQQAANDFVSDNIVINIPQNGNLVIGPSDTLITNGSISITSGSDSLTNGSVSIIDRPIGPISPSTGQTIDAGSISMTGQLPVAGSQTPGSISVIQVGMIQLPPDTNGGNPLSPVIVELPQNGSIPISSGSSTVTDVTTIEDPVSTTISNNGQKISPPVNPPKPPSPPINWAIGRLPLPPNSFSYIPPTAASYNVEPNKPIFGAASIMKVHTYRDVISGLEELNQD